MLPERLAETSDLRQKISQSLGDNSDDRVSGGGGGEAAAGSDPDDVHSLTARTMLRCWNAVGERLAAARKVVTEVAMPMKHRAAAAAGAREDGDRRLKLKRVTKGPRGMRTGAGGTGARAKARKVGFGCA